MLKIKEFRGKLVKFGITLFCIISSFYWLQVATGKTVPQLVIPPAMVEVQQVKYTTIQDNITATGSLVSIPGVVIKPEISGRITNVYFNSGDKVAAGAPLVEIYPDIIKAQLADNEANLKLKQLDFARYSKLYETHTISKAEFDKVQADLDSAKAKVEQSKAQLSQTIVRAPFAGKVGVSSISLGQYIIAGQDSIVSLQSLDPIYVDFSIPEIYAGEIKDEQKIVLRTNAYPKETFDGKVYAIDPLVDVKSRSLSVRAAVPNKDDKLLPGFFADVTLFIGEPKQVIKVPQTAIVFSVDGNYVYRVIDDKAVKTKVVLGERDPQNVIVQSGLNVGDVIVTAGQMKIPQDGAKVIITQPKNDNV